MGLSPESLRKVFKCLISASSVQGSFCPDVLERITCMFASVQAPAGGASAAASHFGSAENSLVFIEILIFLLLCLVHPSYGPTVSANVKETIV